MAGTSGNTANLPRRFHLALGTFRHHACDQRINVFVGSLQEFINVPLGWLVAALPEVGYLNEIAHCIR